MNWIRSQTKKVDNGQPQDMFKLDAKSFIYMNQTNRFFEQHLVLNQTDKPIALCTK